MTTGELEALLEEERVWISQEVEVEVLRDLVFVFQGISGQRIRLDRKSESFLIDPSLHLSPSATDTVLGLCEVGWLYQRVRVVECAPLDLIFGVPPSAVPVLPCGAPREVCGLIAQRR